MKKKDEMKHLAYFDQIPVPISARWRLLCVSERAGPLCDTSESESSVF